MHSHSGIITASILHNLSLAVAYGGPLFAKVGLKKALLRGVTSEKERGKVVQMAWSRFNNKLNVPAHLMFTGTWLVERRAIKQHFGTRRTMRLVALKDVLVTGALITGVANVAASKMLKRDFPDGVSIPTEANARPEDAAKIESYVRFFRIVGRLNRAFVGGSIALGPVIGASIVRQSSRGLLARIFNR